MAPNYGIATRYGREAQLETFLMSNVSPQAPSLNRGLWQKLEEKIAKEYANDFEEVWVLTGPIFDELIQYLPSGVEIPDQFYMIIVDELSELPRMLAFIVPQTATNDSPLTSFLTSVDEIERLTGFDFFWDLEDSLEAYLESQVATQPW